MADNKQFIADIDSWVMVTQKRLTAVVKQSTNDLLKGIVIGPSITRSGAREYGTIPRDLGILAASLQSSLYGSKTVHQEGKNSYSLIIRGMKYGDVASFTWGGPAAPYAMHVHYGANGVPGTYWVDVAASKWSMYVRDSIIRAKAIVK